MARRPLLIAAPTALALTVLFVAPGCLTDLPPATHCPAPPKYAGGGCVPPMNLASHLEPMSACLDTDVSSCLTGRTGPDACACDMNACPDDPAACYPAGDCPAAVSGKVAPRKATCIRLDGLQTGLPGSDCLCGCAACASVCDGVGPVISMIVPPPTMGLPTVTALFVKGLASHLPASGQLGFYVRARGEVASLAVGASYPDGSIYPGAVGLGTEPSDFQETVVFDANASPRWAQQADAPDTLALSANAAMSMAFPALAEIDCIVPFVVQ